MDIYKQDRKHSYNFTNGSVLLIAVLVVAIITAIGLSVSEVIIGEILISGQIEDSFIALYAADIGIERLLYLDRSSGSPLADGYSESKNGEADFNYDLDFCYNATFTEDAATGVTTISVVGEYRCSSVPKVRRAFDVTY